MADRQTLLYTTTFPTTSTHCLLPPPATMHCTHLHACLSASYHHNTTTMHFPARHKYFTHHATCITLPTHCTPANSSHSPLTSLSHTLTLSLPTSHFLPSHTTILLPALLLSLPTWDHRQTLAFRHSVGRLDTCPSLYGICLCPLWPFAFFPFMEID